MRPCRLARPPAGNTRIPYAVLPRWCAVMSCAFSVDRRSWKRAGTLSGHRLAINLVVLLNQGGRAPVSLRLLPATNDDAAPVDGLPGISLLFSDGDTKVACSVTPGVIEDLASYHRLTFSRDEIFHVVLPLLDRLASTKYRAGRLEENGEIVIREADLLRYGFGTVR